MDYDAVVRILGQNLGNRLTPELAKGIADAIAAIPVPDESLPVGHFAPQTYNGFTFQHESIRQILDEIKPLHVQHFAETEGFRASEGVNLDYGKYCNSEHRGTFLLFTVRSPEGKLVGDAMIFVDYNRHTSRRSAFEDAFFIAPEARKGWTALKFLRYVDACLTSLGCSQIAWGCKIENDLEPLYTRLGYKKTAFVFTRVTSAEEDDVLEQ